MITVILPTYNEEPAIGKVIDEIRALSVGCEIVVVDGRSTDRTVEIAKGRGAKILYETLPGKGIAVRYALTQIENKYVIMMDTDHTYPAKYIPLILELLEKADMVVGYRTYLEKGSMSLTNRVGNYLLSLLASILYGKRVYDVCSGMWGFRMDILRKFNLVSEGFTLEADLFLNAIRNKAVIEQIPIGYRKRLDNKPGLKVWDGFRIGWFLIRKRWDT